MTYLRANSQIVNKFLMRAIEPTASSEEDRSRKITLLRIMQLIM